MRDKRQTIALVSVGLLLAVSIVAGLINPYLQSNKKISVPAQSSTQSGETAKETNGKQRIAVPDFTFTDMDKNEIQFSDMVGTPIVINFWATWCPYCVVEMEDFDKLIGEYEGKVKFIMLDAWDGVRETEKEVNAYLEKSKFEHLVPYLDAVDNQGIRTFGVQSFPTTVFIDAEGNLYDAVIGKTSYKAVKEILDRELSV